MVDGELKDFFFAFLKYRFDNDISFTELDKKYLLETFEAALKEFSEYFERDNITDPVTLFDGVE